MLQVDGAQKSGSGTIVRNAAVIAGLLGEPLHLFNIRAGREVPGLRHQHLWALRALAQLCQGQIEGGMVGSREIYFRPGGRPQGGSFQWDIGTAGSTTMLALTLLPAAAFATGPVGFQVTGGLFQDFAPSAFHMKDVLLPTLKVMGFSARVEILRPGYVPRGEGILRVEAEPVVGRLCPLTLPPVGGVAEIWGVALSSHLRERRVSQRMAQACQQALSRKGYQARFEVWEDDTALQPGAALALFARSNRGALLGVDRAGAPHRPAEEIGRYVAKALTQDLASGASVDRFLSDQLILYAALAQGESSYYIPEVTEHVETNLWLAETLLGAKATLEGRRLQIKGISYSPES